MRTLDSVRESFSRAISSCEYDISRERDKIIGGLAEEKVAIERRLKELRREEKKLDAIVKAKIDWCQKNGILIVE